MYDSRSFENFLVVHKTVHWDDPSVTGLLEKVRDIVLYLLKHCPTGHVLMQADSPILQTLKTDEFGDLPHLMALEMDDKAAINHIDNVHLIVTIGGDGTVLAAAYLFQSNSGQLPPILPLHSGTLGFLNVSDASVTAVDRFLCKSKASEHDFVLNKRMRLYCRVFHSQQKAEEAEEISIGEQQTMVMERHVLNEVVIERGSTPSILTLQVLCNGTLLTTIQADGLIVATPTGSTAYSLSAGGSVVHPAVPAMVLTPICAHTLSIRPLVLPSDLQLQIRIAGYHSGQVSFDGRTRLSMDVGDSVFVTESALPVRTVCRSDQTSDWFHGLATCLRWNDRPGWSAPL